MLKSKVVILSTGRSGSTFLSNLLGSFSNEDKFEHQVKYSRLVNILGNLVLCGKISAEKSIKIIQKLSPELLGVSSGDPLRSVMLQESLKEDTSVKFVHVIRDPRTFVSSFMNWKMQGVKKKILHHIIPFWQPNPYNHGECGLLDYISMDKFEQFCWIWNLKNQHFSKLKSKSNYLLFRMEDLISGKREAIEELGNFLDLDTQLLHQNLSKPSMNASKNKKFPNWENWSTTQCETLHQHCGKLMHDLGYGNELNWKSKLK